MLHRRTALQFGQLLIRAFKLGTKFADLFAVGPASRPGSACLSRRRLGLFLLDLLSRLVTCLGFFLYFIFEVFGLVEFLVFAIPVIRGVARQIRHSSPQAGFGGPLPCGAMRSHRARL